MLNCRYRIFGFILFLALTMSSCSMDEESLAATIQSNVHATISQFTQVPSQTSLPTYTAFPTQTDFPTYTPIPTYTPNIIIVTPTATETPIYTATITNTPTETAIPTPTKDPTTEDKKPGFYLVGEDIAPGVWRSQGTGDGCYWAVTSKTGSILSNHYGMAGGTMYVPSHGFQVELDDDCGTWKYLGE
jgi:hypothetical protein